jgi:hypothetical protein
MEALEPVVMGASILKGKRGEASTVAAEILYHPSG